MTPPELTRLRARLAEITDLQALGALMFWDQNTMMPPGGAGARADMADTLQRTLHERETDPELVTSAPHDAPVGRLDEATAARQPNLRWRGMTGAEMPCPD